MSLYRSIEELHSMHLQRALVATQEAQASIEVQQKIICQSNSNGHKALATGNNMEWIVARMQADIAEWKQKRLQKIRSEREAFSDEARRQYMASHLQSEQIKHVVSDAAARVRSEEERRIQSGLDDRFLARQRWIAGQKKWSR